MKKQRFNIPMENALSMDKFQALYQLVQILLHPFFLKRLLALFYVLVHVSLHELEDQGESLFGFVTFKVNIMNLNGAHGGAVGRTYYNTSYRVTMLACPWRRLSAWISRSFLT